MRDYCSPCLTRYIDVIGGLRGPFAGPTCGHGRARGPKAERMAKATSAEDPRERSLPLDVSIKDIRDLWWGKCKSRCQRLLFVTHDASCTGAPRILLELLIHFARDSDFDPRVLMLKGGELSSSFSEVAPTLDAEQQCSGVGLKLILQEILGSEPPGAAICNTVATSEIAAAISALGIPIIALVHEQSPTIEIVCGSRAIGTIVNIAEAVVVPSIFTRDDLVRHYAISPDRFTVLPQGVRSSAIGHHGRRKEIRRLVALELGTTPAKMFLVVGCGTISPRKGFDLFVQSAFRLRNMLGDRAGPIRYVWFGDADESFAAWHLHDAERLGLSGQLRWLGMRSDVAELMVAGDVFLLPSRDDPFPNV